ncbi:hypothetical protein LCGC14_1288140 [marine sediment metagenome]|uniref:Uncharacterized protein n=1 Tax=marine sediment metagenome TaxID=412755 RepID=A0A0F9KTA0_9ZZZZ
MFDDATEPVAVSRSAWMAVMELARHTDMSLSEKIASLNIERADFDTRPFLAMQLKLIQNIIRGYEQETAEKLEGSKGEESEIEIELTLAEALYLHLTIGVADFKGAMTLKKHLWRVISTLYEREKKA